MARFEFKMPDIGEGITEGEIVGWAEGIAPGVEVKADQALVEVMTDKATVTITTPKAGRILELGGNVGQVIAVGKILAVIEVQDHASVPAPEPPPARRSEPAATAVGDIREHLPGMGPEPWQVPQVRAAEEGDRPLAAPATRKLAREMGVDLRTVHPSGPAGRITLEDVKAQAGASGPAPAAQMRREPVRVEAPAGPSGSLEERTPLRGIRKRIFEAMARSKHTAAHFTFVEECDVTALKPVRERMKEIAEGRGVQLSYLPFIVKAVVASLHKHPSLNSAYDEATDEIVTRRYYNIGIATATDAGLVVPVIKGADTRSLIDIAAEIQRLSSDARAGKIKLEDLQGSTFTITSLGAQGGLFATPILNYPEVGILGVHRIKQKPVVRNGQIAIGDVMLLSLSFDHRLIDGHVGAAFAYEVIQYLENPDLLMLEAV